MPAVNAIYSGNVALDTGKFIIRRMHASPPPRTVARSPQGRVYAKPALLPILPVFFAGPPSYLFELGPLFSFLSTSFFGSAKTPVYRRETAKHQPRVTGEKTSILVGERGRSKRHECDRFCRKWRDRITPRLGVGEVGTNTSVSSKGMRVLLNSLSHVQSNLAQENLCSRLGASSL